MDSFLHEPQKMNEDERLSEKETNQSKLFFSYSLVESIEEIKYLTSEIAHRLRPIMRFIYKEFNRQRYWVPQRDIWNSVKSYYGSDSSEQNLFDDLEILCANKNLRKDYERRYVRSVEEFYHKRIMYQPTALAIEIERFVSDLEQKRGTLGSLNTSQIDSLLKNLLYIDKILTQPRPSEMAEQLSNLWRDSYRLFQEFTRGANDYLGEMRRVDYEKLQQLDGYLRYKEAVIKYLEEFSYKLEGSKPLIQNLVNTWRKQLLTEQLFSVLADFNSKIPRPDGTFPNFDTLYTEYMEQFDAVHAWYQVGGGVDMIRSMTIASIELVLKQAANLIERYNNGLSRRQELAELARRFAECTQVSECNRLAVESFLLPQVRHIKGIIDVHIPRNMPNDWDERSKPELIELGVIRRGARQRSPGNPIRDRRLEQELLRQKIRAEKEAEVACIKKVFNKGNLLNCESFSVESSEERRLLLKIIRECQVNPHRNLRLIDGTKVSLADNKPKSRGVLTCPDGILNMPAFTIIREDD